jgi:hypothetical protein
MHKNVINIGNSSIKKENIIVSDNIKNNKEEIDFLKSML